MVGAYFGDAALGLSLGALAGNELFPTQLPNGPKLTDNRTTTASIGDPIPIVFGTASVSGTVMWLAPFVEHDDKSKQQTTYSYTQSIAILLCEAVADGSTAIANLTRIWENGTIVYDIRPQQPADTANGMVAETDQQYANRLTASAAYAETFTLHLGDETQVADPTIEAVEGAGNVPAFRGLAYIVYPNRQLLISQGWRHPNFVFEVAQAGVGECTTISKYSNQVLYPWLGDGSVDPTNPNNVNTFHLFSWDAHAPNHVDFPGADYLFPTLAAAQAYVAPAFNGSTYEVYMGYAISTIGGAVNQLVQAGAIAFGAQYHAPDPGDLFLHFNWQHAHEGYLLEFPASGNYLVSTEGTVFNAGGTLFETLGGYWPGYPHPPIPSLPEIQTPWCFVNANRAYGYTNSWTQSEDVVIEVRRAPAPPLQICSGLLPAPGYDGYCILPSGDLVKSTDWVLDTVNNYYVMQAANVISGGDQTNYKATYPLNPVLPQGDPQNTEAFWTAAYNAHVAEGSMPAGLTYSTGGGSGHYPQFINTGPGSTIYTIDYTVCEGLGAQVNVANIIAALCARAGLSGSSIDVSDVASTFVSGYAISSLSDATSSISPLRSIAFFDAIESGLVLRFQSRGKPIVATLSTDQIGCFDDAQSGDNAPPSVTVSRTDETTLPRSIRLHYKSVNRDYQDGEQLSPFRLTTRAVNDQDIQLPFCLGDTQALQCAEVLWADAWASQNIYTLSIDQSLSEIEVGDCIGVPVDNVIQRMRIVSEQNSSQVLRKLSCVSDTGGAYISYAVAEPSQVQPQRLTILAPSAAELLDIPAIQDSDNDAGFYVAAQPVGDGASWKGATIYKSTDGGSTYNTLFSNIVAATIATLSGAVAPSESYTWDDETEINLALNSADFSFESITDDAVLNGGNLAAMGADGRWELIQFATATQISGTQWRLTRLLRGRRGTEHNIPKSQMSDAFVMISTSDLNRAPLNTTEIGALRQYRATSIGASLGGGTVYPFTGRAVALMPFSAVDVQAQWQSDNDIAISWIRRDRLGRTLMSGVDMPLSEATLAFQVDILYSTAEASPDPVLRTIDSSTINCIYTAAQQMTDFGSHVSSVRVAIYQMSAVVGRGIPAYAVLTQP